MTIVAINQPGYLPWMGFFKRIMYSDIFVFLDDVQYLKKDWQNRNKIRTSQSWMWLSVPVKKNHSIFCMHSLGPSFIFSAHAKYFVAFLPCNSRIFAVVHKHPVIGSHLFPLFF